MTPAEQLRWRRTVAAVSLLPPAAPRPSPSPAPGQLRLAWRLCGTIPYWYAIEYLPAAAVGERCRCGRALARRRVPRVQRTVQDPLPAPLPAPVVPGPITWSRQRQGRPVVTRVWQDPWRAGRLERLESAAERALVAQDAREELERYIGRTRDDGRSWRPCGPGGVRP